MAWHKPNSNSNQYYESIAWWFENLQHKLVLSQVWSHRLKYIWNGSVDRKNRPLGRKLPVAVWYPGPNWITVNRHSFKMSRGSSFERMLRMVKDVFWFYLKLAFWCQNRRFINLTTIPWIITDRFTISKSCSIFQPFAAFNVLISAWLLYQRDVWKAVPQSFESSNHQNLRKYWNHIVNLYQISTWFYILKPIWRHIQ